MRNAGSIHFESARKRPKQEWSDGYRPAHCNRLRLRPRRSIHLRPCGTRSPQRKSGTVARRLGQWLRGRRAILSKHPIDFSLAGSGSSIHSLPPFFDHGLLRPYELLKGFPLRTQLDLNTTAKLTPTGLAFDNGRREIAVLDERAARSIYRRSFLMRAKVGEPSVQAPAPYPRRLAGTCALLRGSARPLHCLFHAFGESDERLWPHRDSGSVELESEILQ